MRRSTIVSLSFLALTATAARAQQPAPAPTTPPLEVGAPAPDFTLPGGTRYGVLRDPIHLGDFHGKTVILAFFFRSRTRG
ncbi:MAG: hypothetical protein ACHQC8_08305 [Solirubrobacterales bacterium]